MAVNKALKNKYD